MMIILPKAKMDRVVGKLRRSPRSATNLAYKGGWAVYASASCWLWRLRRGYPKGYVPEFPLGRVSANEAPLEGKAFVILGSAPSSADFDVKSAIDNGITVMALNGAFRTVQKFDVKADILVMSNPHAMKEYGREAIKSCRSTFLSTSASQKSNFLPEDAYYFRQWARPGMDEGFVETDLSKPLFQSGTVAHPALQIALALGATLILFVGVDLVADPSCPHAYASSEAEKKRAKDVFVKNAERMSRGFVSAKETIEKEVPDVGVFCLDVPRTNNPFKKITWIDFLKKVNQTPGS